MSKGLKELTAGTTESQLAVKIRESANQIWLAGLGAFSKAQKEGVKMFEALVAEGEKVQVTVDERLADIGLSKAMGALRERATDTTDKLEKVFEDRVGRALHVLNVPTHKDIDVLSKRVHELTAMTKKMSEEEEAHGRGRARAKAE